MTLQWSQLPKKEGMQKEAAAGECVHTNTGKQSWNVDFEFKILKLKFL